MGRVAARAAQDALLAGEHARDGIVHAGVNVAIVEEKRVGNGLQPRGRLAIAGDDGLFAQVSAGHHQRPA